MEDRYKSEYVKLVSDHEKRRETLSPEQIDIEEKSLAVRIEIINAAYSKPKGFKPRQPTI